MCMLSASRNVTLWSTIKNMLLLKKNWHKHNVGMQFGALGLYFIGELFRWTQQHILSIIESVDSISRDERDSP